MSAEPRTLAAFITDDMPEWDDALGMFPRMGHVIGGSTHSTSAPLVG